MLSNMMGVDELYEKEVDGKWKKKEREKKVDHIYGWDLLLTLLEIDQFR